MPVAQRPVTSRPGKRRPQLSHQRDGHHVAGQRSLAETSELRARLQDHDRADKKTRKQYDGEGASADAVHLLQNVLEIVRRGDQADKRAATEDGVILHIRHGAFERVDQHSRDGDFRFRLVFVATCNLQRCVCHEYLFVHRCAELLGQQS